MKIRLQVTAQRTAEAERLWLLNKVNSLHKGRRMLLRHWIWIVALMLVFAAALLPRFR